MRLFDCFCYCGEADLLEIRLEELEGLVDAVVIVESRRTWKGAPKPLHFEAVRDRFSRHAGRIRYVALDDVTTAEAEAMRRLHPRKKPANDFWAREWAQRDAILRGLADAGDDDLVMVSDVDEIPRREAIERVLGDRWTRRSLWFIEHRNYAGRLNLRQDNAGPWVGARVVARRWLGSPQRLRLAKSEGHRKALPGTRALDWWGRAWVDFGFGLWPRRLADAGWHFQAVGSATDIAARAERILEDMSAYSGITSPEVIDARMKAGLDYRGLPTRLAPLREMPRAVRERPDRFTHILAPETGPVVETA